MNQEFPVTAHSALLRVLIAGESEGADLIRKVKDWTGGQVVLDDNTFATMVQELEAQGLVERHLGLADKRTGQPRQTFTLTTKGQQSAMEILAASLTRNS